jgi:uncharacterized protein
MQSDQLIEVVDEKFANIPCLHLKPIYLEEPFGTVFLYHGWGATKEITSFYGSVLAHYGYQVIIPEIIYHGDRGSLNYSSAEVRQEKFWEIIIQSVDEFKTLFKELFQSLNINAEKVAIIGNSMGGFIASGIFANNPSIKSLIVTNSSCAWENAEHLFRKIESRPQAIDEELKEIRKYDPISKINLMYPRNILLLHGSNDQFIPIETQEFFYNHIKDLYKDLPQNIRFKKYPRLNHYVILGMLQEIIEWLAKFLK